MVNATKKTYSNSYSVPRLYWGSMRQMLLVSGIEFSEREISWFTRYFTVTGDIKTLRRLESKLEEIFAEDQDFKVDNALAEKVFIEAENLELKISNVHKGWFSTRFTAHGSTKRLGWIQAYIDNGAKFYYEL